MTDFEFDCFQKKQLARMARYRKRGSKSKKCRMSTDYMTEKQWKERNGKLYTCNLNKPVSWAGFKDLPRNIQEEYIRHMIELYNVNASSLAQMFGVRPLTVRRLIEANKLGISFKVGNSMNAAQRERWNEFLAGGRVVPAPDPEPAADVDMAEEPEEQFRPGSMSMKQFSLVFQGKLDPTMIANSILSIAGQNAEGKIEIICTL